MKTLIALLVTMTAPSTVGDDKSHQLDLKVIGLLLDQSDLVVLGHKDTNGNVGMDARLKQRYGLISGQSGFGMSMKETLVGPAVTEKVISFSYARPADDEPFFLPEGDYVLFLRRGAQKNWILVGDYLGIQLWTKGLDVLVKEVHAAMAAKTNDGRP